MYTKFNNIEFGSGDDSGRIGLRHPATIAIVPPDTPPVRFGESRDEIPPPPVTGYDVTIEFEMEQIEPLRERYACDFLYPAYRWDLTQRPDNVRVIFNTFPIRGQIKFIPVPLMQHMHPFQLFDFMSFIISRVN